MNQIQTTFPEHIQIIGKGGRRRESLASSSMKFLSLYARLAPFRLRRVFSSGSSMPRLERSNYLTLQARLTPANGGIQNLYIFPSFKKLRFSLRREDKWLDRGIPLHRLGEFCKVARLIPAPE